MLDRTTRGDLGHGANLLVRAAALAAVGGWDESLGAGARFTSSPEADLYDRLFLAGFHGRYEPAARAWHEQWRSSRQLIQLDWRYGFGNGARLAKLCAATGPGRADRRRGAVVVGPPAAGRAAARPEQDRGGPSGSTPGWNGRRIRSRSLHQGAKRTLRPPPRKLDRDGGTIRRAGWGLVGETCG